MDTERAVSGVVSAFHTGVDLVEQIRKKSKKKKGEQAIKYKILQETLEAGETQVSRLYTKHFNDLGERFKVGDDISLNKLLTIAVSMQSDLIRGLQLVVQFDNAVLDLAKFQEDVVMSKRDTMTVLDELHFRVLHSGTPDAPAQFNHPIPQRPSFESVPSSTMARSPTSDQFVPAGVTVPAAAEPRGSISRWLSNARSSKRMSVSSTSSTTSAFVQTLLPTPEMLGPAIEPIEEPPPVPTYYSELPAEDVDLPLARDIKSPIQEPDNNLHPALGTKARIARHPSSSTTRSEFSDEKISLHPATGTPNHISRHPSTSSRSDFSDEKIALPLARDDEDQSYASHLPPAEVPLPLRPHSNIYSSSYATIQPTRSPTSTISNVSMLPSPITLGPGQTFDYRRSSVQRPLSSESDNLYNNPPTLQSIPQKQPLTTNPSRPAPKRLAGRPDKKNSYWGFCKGAWTIQEEWRKGLSIYQVPTGMYDLKPVWRCKSCNFEGNVKGVKKPFEIDQKVHVVAVGGVQVRYRWVFLAKSHTKRTALPPSMTSTFVGLKEGNETTYGCIFCVAHLYETAIYGNVETLCEHLVREHATGMSQKLMTDNNCIVDRVAKDTEAFDINITGRLNEV